MSEQNPVAEPVADTTPQPLTAPPTAPVADEPQEPTDEPDEPADEPEPSKATFNDIVPPLINSITGKQWLGIRRRFEMDTQELGGDVTGQLILACWKKRLQETGKSEWEWLDDMTHTQYAEYLGIRTDSDEDDEADKSA